MLKQLAFLVASNLAASTETGTRLLPIVIFVQRIVRFLRDTNTNMKKLVNRRGLFPWYVKHAFSKVEATMLLMAFEERACVIMMDGVDEAAGERDLIEEFVHFELVPSGNRVVITSRPTGVNRELYDRYWVVSELLPLTTDLQRKVIKMQMRGSVFFDHLITLVPLRQEVRAVTHDFSRTQVHLMFWPQLSSCPFIHHWACSPSVPINFVRRKYASLPITL